MAFNRRSHALPPARRPSLPRQSSSSSTLSSTSTSRSNTTLGPMAGHKRTGLASNQRIISGGRQRASVRDRSRDRSRDRGEEGVLLTNVPSSRTAGGEAGTLIDPDEILMQAQETDVSKVFEIALHGSKIHKITNLEAFKRVRVLDLSCNEIKKIENLHMNSGVRELKLYGNKIKDIANLDCLKDLCHLQLQHNEIEHVGRGLSSLRRLSLLRLDSNRLRQLEAREITSCAALVTLDLSDNLLDCVSAVGSLPNLEELCVAKNRLSTIADLSRCKKLKEVDVSHNQLRSLAGLRNVRGLQILNGSRNQLTSLESLGKQTSLQELDFSENKVSELMSFPEVFPVLEILDATHNAVEEWQEVMSLRCCDWLVELCISDNPFCLEDSPHAHYSADLTAALPALEVLDRAHVRRPEVRSLAPVMRPMSASSVVSSRQVASQLAALQHDLQCHEDDIQRRFGDLRSRLSTLPKEKPARVSTVLSQTTSDELKLNLGSLSQTTVSDKPKHPVETTPDTSSFQVERENTGDSRNNSSKFPRPPPHSRQDSAGSRNNSATRDSRQLKARSTVLPPRQRRATSRTKLDAARNYADRNFRN